MMSFGRPSSVSAMSSPLIVVRFRFPLGTVAKSSREALSARAPQGAADTLILLAQATNAASTTWKEPAGESRDLVGCRVPLVLPRQAPLRERPVAVRSPRRGRGDLAQLPAAPDRSSRTRRGSGHPPVEQALSLIHISEPTRQAEISYA